MADPEQVYGERAVFLLFFPANSCIFDTLNFFLVFPRCGLQGYIAGKVC